MAKTPPKKTPPKKTTSKGVTHKTEGRDRRTPEEIELDQRVARNLALMQQLEAEILASRQRRR